MASAGDLYLPNLQECFAGQASVISWTEILTQLMHENISDLENRPLIFLDSSLAARILPVPQLLSRPVPILPTPSSQSKEDFGTKTAAINIAPSPDGCYDIDEIKEDTLWLSKSLNLDEVECLRIALLEWQTRPVAQLRNGLSDTEAASLRDAIGSEEYGLGRSDTPGPGPLADPAFLSQERRRSRLVTLCMQEQGSMFGISVILTDIFLQTDFIISSRGEVPQDKNFAGRLKATVKGSLQSPKAQQSGLSTCFDGLRDCLDSLAKGPPWAGESFDSSELQDDWACSMLNQVSALIELILLHHKSAGAYTESHHTLSWLRLMVDRGFLGSFEPLSMTQAMLCTKIQALASTCTLAVLYLSEATEYIERLRASPESQTDRNAIPPYFMDSDAVAEIHQLMMTFAAVSAIQASPAMLAWGLILGNVDEIAATSKELREASQVQKAIDNGSRDSTPNRRLSSSSIGSIQQSLSEDVMDSIRPVSHGENDIQHLISAAVVACQVFEYMAHLCASEASRTPISTMVQAEIFQQLIITSIVQTEYTDSIVAAQLALIDALADIAIDPRTIGDVYALKVRWFHEQSGVREVLEVAASRFPYEMLPFLRLCSSLARLRFVNDDGHEYISAFLHNLPTYTQQTSLSFSAYHTTREYENANLVSLDANLDMIDSIESQRLLNFHGHVTELTNTVPSGTIGEVVREGRPPVIKWLHSYSGLAFLGLWLDAFRCGQLQGTISDQEELEITATNTLDLLNKVVSNAHHDRATNPEHTSAVLSNIASGLPDDIDLISMIFDICEQRLQSLRHKKQDVRSCEIVVACLKLITILLPLLPSRVWPSLSRSTLVDTRGTSAGVIAIIVSIETTRAEYEFLEAYAKLHQTMVEDAIRQAVGIGILPGPARVASHDDFITGMVPIRIIDSVILASTKTMMNSFQAAPRWKFSSPSQRTSIATKISHNFHCILQYVYGADDSLNSATKLTAGLASSAAYIVDALRPHAEEALGPGSLLRWLLVSWQASAEASDLQVNLGLSKQICAVSGLTATVMRLGTFLNSTQSALEAQILDALPAIVRLGTLDTKCSSATLNILTVLLQTTSPEDAPSLLGRLGSVSARAFLESILPAVRRTGDDRISLSESSAIPSFAQDERVEHRIKVWDLFASFITHGQQWFAITLLTGSPPDFTSKTRSESKQQVPLRGKPVLTEALDYFDDMNRLDLGLAATVLDFVVKSQMHWNWVTDSIQSHPKLLPSLITFVSSLSSQHPRLESQSNKIAALVVELATVQLHYARSRRDKDMIRKMIPLMRWLTSNAIDVAAYNASLHSNLRKNFAAQYGSCTLANFKRTKLFEREYGDEFYYDIKLAGKMLSHQDGQSRRPDFDQSFHQELIRVNLNLSLVDSQILLLDSFQSLCIEHCVFFSQDADVQKIMATVVQNLLTANTTSPPPEQIFETLFQTRAEFALVMIRRLAEIKSRGSKVSGLLSAAWDALRFRNLTYEFAIDNDDLGYFRMTLTILLLAMQFHTEKRQSSQDRLALVSSERDPTSSIVLEVASVIVADGMKSVVSCLHDQTSHSKGIEMSADGSLVDARDVSLILSVLQTILRLHNLPHMTSQLGSGFVSSSIVQSCLLLYSWSHTLTTPETNNEPVYSELSLQFLVSLSSLPQVAEELAVEGVLSRISTARVTQLLRAVKGGACHFDKRPFIATLYGVWQTGLLPLCLNLLHSVGRAMAGEVATFLNQFPQQLARASKAFSFHNAAGEPLTLVLANEGAVLALISRVLTNYRVAGASAGVDAYDIPALEGYDDQRAAIVEDVREILVCGRLKVSAAATSEKEAAWQKMWDGTGADKLELAIIAELNNVLVCLSDGGEQG